MLNVESQGPVVRITLNRPEVKNALNAALITDLRAAFSNLDPKTRVVVLTGAGDTFCAGGDLNWMREAAGYTPEQNEADALNLAGLFQAMVDCPAFVIAAVNGNAFGGGCGLIAAADTVIAVEAAKFAFSEVKLGLIPATISPFVLRKIGMSHAVDLFGTARLFDAAHAQRIGLAHIVTADLDAEVARLVKTLLGNGPQAVTAAKRLAQADPKPNEETARLLAETRAGEEAREGIAAFLEKRAPSFREDI